MKIFHCFQALPVAAQPQPNPSLQSQAEWRPLIGQDPSRYCALIG